MPPAYFARSHYPLLAQLCRHIVASNRVAMLIKQCREQKKVDLAQLESLLAMQRAETNAIIRLSRSMRLTHQSLHRADSTKQRPVLSPSALWDQTKRPWHRQ
jgi:hypothetical protein